MTIGNSNPPLSLSKRNKVLSFDGIAFSAFYQPVSVVPLAIFRVVFGLAMFVSTVRFLLLGWVEEQYLRPIFHFTYYGFEWVQVLPPWGMYGLYVLMLVSSLGIMLGYFYRISALVYFLAFTYTELLDKTYYLNHYYFVSLVSFLLCFIPANRYWALDTLRHPGLKSEYVQAWSVNLLKFQIGCVYFFAGVAKINADWLLHAMPLRLWLPAQDDMPILGPLLREMWVAYAFSWVGMVYDLAIPFLLLMRATRLPAYIVLLIFHAMTGYFFQIGVFPLVMSLCTLIFFPNPVESARHLLTQIKYKMEGGRQVPLNFSSPTTFHEPPTAHHSSHITYLLLFYILLQLVVPWRYLLYHGNLFWTEEGYRFSWRVMLVEKAGYANFRVRDNHGGNEFDVVNRQFLNVHQEKQMSFQPDMILQYAHFLGDYYRSQGIQDPSIFCDCYVTMNGKASQLLVNPKIDLLKEEEGFGAKKWIFPFKN